MIRAFRSKLAGVSLVLVFQFCASTAFGATCENLESESFGSDISREYFLAQNYSEFIAYMGTVGIDIQNPEEFTDKMSSVAPEGFEKCVQLVERDIEPGMREDILLLIGPSDERVYLGFLLYRRDGKWLPMKFNISGEFEEVFGSIVR